MFLSDYFWLFSEQIAPFPVFPQLTAFAPTCHIFPGKAILHRVCSLFPSISSEVMITGLENVVAVMTALSKSYKQGGYRGSINKTTGPFL